MERGLSSWLILRPVSAPTKWPAMHFHLYLSTKSSQQLLLTPSLWVWRQQPLGVLLPIFRFGPSFWADHEQIDPKNTGYPPPERRKFRNSLIGVLPGIELPQEVNRGQRGLPIRSEPDPRLLHHFPKLGRTRCVVPD